ncbi:hypothetical protein [Leminorella grimontii]|uniref:hypothetical protein n=1 Tax=Leminorella grimontii TaxID=82981 RepID=UPI0032204210
MRLKELIASPTGRLSTSDTILMGAFLVSSFAMIWETLCGRLAEWHIAAYLGAWVIQSQGAKWQALKRDREVEKNV